MKPKNFSIVLGMAALMAIVSGCFSDGIRGSGTVVSEPRDVKDFTNIEVVGTGTLLIEQSDTESLSIRTDDNLLEHLTATVENGTLKLATRNEVNLRPSSGITYTLLVKKLEKIGVSGGAEIEAKGIQTESMTIAVSGAGEIKMTGETVDLMVAISGAGDLSAEEFSSKNASVSISGAGHALVKVSDRLDVEVSGVAEVEYVGDPKVTKNTSGVATVNKRS